MFVILHALRFTLYASQAFASGKLGVHILEPEEIGRVFELLPNGGYVTVPIRLDQLQKDRWQQFFDSAADASLIPILRLATRFDGTNWTRPTRRDTVSLAQFLSSLDWRADELRIIAFNEPNHAAEWGGAVDPNDYGETLAFLVNWFRTEPRKYLILSAGLDVAARDTATSLSGYAFLKQLIGTYPDTITKLDGWASHAYPNPHFSGSPYDDHRQSVRSYEYELGYLSRVLEKELPVYITETGWDGTQRSEEIIAKNFTIAYDDVWNPDDRVAAVTPFILSAQDGPFVSFSLIGRDDKPTALFETIQSLATL